jgi:aryl-alcohol dehydrogenase-like predicted oxidoreductase
VLFTNRRYLNSKLYLAFDVKNRQISRNTRRRKGGMMQVAKLPNIDKELSVICLGTGQYGSRISAADSFRLLDRFAELGGTFIDTAHVYGAWDVSGYNGGYGNSEKVIGEWLAKTGMQQKIAVGTKGGHPDLDSGVSRMNPEDISLHISESLERLQIDAIDMYWIHKDEPSIPAGEILGMVSEHVEAGRIKALGCSNWNIQRQQEAAKAATRLGLTGFVASQIGWSLARATQSFSKPEHADMLYMNADILRYHIETKTPVAGYSAQAGGFFAAKYAGLDFEASDFPKPALATKYGNSLSYSRRTAAAALAREIGCSANQVALAWMMHHPFLAFPIASPATLQQLDDTMKAGEIELSDEAFRKLTCGQAG